MSRRTKSARSLSDSTSCVRRGNAILPDSAAPATFLRYPVRAVPGKRNPSCVHVFRVVGIGDSAVSNGGGDLLDAVPHALRGTESPEAFDAVEGNAIRAGILRLRLDPNARLRQAPFDLLLEVSQLVVLQIVAH